MKRVLFLLLLIPVVTLAQTSNVSYYPTFGAGNISGNATYVAGLGPELAPAITAANWTCGAGWDCSVAGTLNKNADGVGTAAPTTPLTIVAGTTYKVVITVGALTVASGATYTLGGTSGTALSSAATVTDYLTAATTGNLIITPTPTGTRFTITAVSVKALTDSTGDVTVDGNLTVRSQALFSTGSSTLPSIAFAQQSSTGFNWCGNSCLYTSLGGTPNATFTGSELRLGSTQTLGFSSNASALLAAADTNLYRDGGSGILALRGLGTASSAAPQEFRVYNFCDGASCGTGYELGFIKFSSNVFQIGTQVAGTGTARSTQISGDNVIISSTLLKPVTNDTADLGTSAINWANLYVDRSIVGSKSKSIPDNTPTTFATMAIPQTAGSNYGGGKILYTILCRNATNQAAFFGDVYFVCHNLAGTEACSFDNSNWVSIGDGTAAITDPPTFTAAGGADLVTFSVQCDCIGITPTSQTMDFRFDMPHPNTLSVIP